MTNDQRGEAIPAVETLFRGGIHAGLTDVDLLQRFLARDSSASAAFEVLVIRHGPMVWNVCRRMLLEPVDAADAFQATFLILVRKAKSVQINDSLAPWLHGVTVRVARRVRVVVRRRQARERTNAVLPDRAISTDSPDFEVRSVIDQELVRLPTRYRAALSLCYLEGLTHEEAATRLACPVGTVRSRLARGRDLLRTRLIRRGFAPTLVAASAILEPGTAAAACPERLIAETARLVSARAAATGIATLAGSVIRSMVLAKLGRVAVLIGLASIVLGSITLAALKRSKPEANDAPLPLITVEELEMKIAEAAEGFQKGLIEAEFDREELDFRSRPRIPLAPRPDQQNQPPNLLEQKVEKPVYHKAPGRFRYRSDGRRWNAEYDSFSLGIELSPGVFPIDQWRSGYDGTIHFRTEGDLSTFILGEAQPEARDQSPAILFWDGTGKKSSIERVMATGSKLSQRTVGGFRCYVVESRDNDVRVEAVISPRQSYLPISLNTYHDGQLKRSFQSLDPRRMADGRWYPSRLIVEERHDYAGPNATMLEKRRETRIVKFEPDHVFKDSDFALNLPDNATILDRRTGLLHINDPWWPEIQQYLQEKFDWPRADLESLNALKSPDATLAGRAAPPLSAARWIRGQPFEWNDTRGKVVLLVFPNPGDPSLVPALRRLAKEYAPLGLVVVEVMAQTADRGPEDSVAYVNEYDIDHTMIDDAPGGYGATCTAYGLKGESFPAAYLIDHEGKLGVIEQGGWAKAVVDQLKRAGAKDVKPLAAPEALGVGLWRLSFRNTWNEWTRAAPSTAKLVGTVVDAQGRPVAGAKVQARLFTVISSAWKRSLRFDGDRSFDATTSPDGGFLLNPLCKGNYSVEVSAPGLATVRRDVMIGAKLGEVGLKVVLGQSSEIVGVVRDAEGRAVAGASVELYNRHYKGPNDSTIYTLELKRTAATDAAGRFRLTGVLEGFYSVKISGQGFASQTREEVAAGSDTQEWTLKLALKP